MVNLFLVQTQLLVRGRVYSDSGVFFELDQKSKIYTKIKMFWN